MFFYFAYGLRIGSSIELPELTPAPPCPEEHVDIGVFLQPESWPFPEAGTGETPEQNLLPSQEHGLSLCWDEAGRFFVSHGRQITIQPHHGVEERVLRLFLLGPVLATLLHQRGILVLHASVVMIGGEAVAFLGGSGWGKSTMAAAFYHCGHTIVSDDQAAIKTGEDRPLVLPSLPQLKLWPESVAVLEDDASTLPQLHPGHDKRARRLRERFATAAIPLSHIFVLNRGERLENEPLGPREALLELMAHSYCAALVESENAPAHLKQCAEIVAEVSVSRLKRPDSLELLPEIVRFVEEQCAGA